MSQATLDWSQSLALMASPRATTACVKSWSETDFRQDLAAIKVPALFIHGSSDKTVPPEVSAEKAVKLVTSAELRIYDGEPHGLNVTAKDRLNRDILLFASGQQVPDDFSQDDYATDRTDDGNRSAY